MSTVKTKVEEVADGKSPEGKRTVVEYTCDVCKEICGPIHTCRETGVTYYAEGF